MDNSKDKIVIDTQDDPTLSDYFSTREAGDSVPFKGSATLDENADGTVILSIDTINFAAPKGAKKKTDDSAAQEEEEEPAAVLAMRSRQDQEEPSADSGEEQEEEAPQD
jgi:hypothetical protein